MATFTEQLNSMRQMQENWDGYGAAPPQADAIDLARELVELLESVRPNSVCHVSPTRVGGVLIELEQREIEVYPSGRISVSSAA